MAVSVQGSLWDSVMELTKVAQQKGSDPLIWAVQLSSNLGAAGATLPSVELANMLVSHICWDNNVPIAWKFLDKALMLKIVPPMLVLALLSTRFVHLTVTVENFTFVSDEFVSDLSFFFLPDVLVLKSTFLFPVCFLGGY